MHRKSMCTLIYPATDFEPMDWLRFIHLTPFDRKWTNLGLDDDDLRILQIAIMAGPDRQPVVPNSGGLRKIRFGRKDASQGKRGGLRIGYAYFPDNQIVLLITVYAKNESSDLSAADRKAIARIIGLIKEQLEQEVIK
jgi:mRNA-degrading endonuclease RelE of RelBE toxin-antitoxin system